MIASLLPFPDVRDEHIKLPLIIVDGHLVEIHQRSRWQKTLGFLELIQRDDLGIP